MAQYIQKHPLAGTNRVSRNTLTPPSSDASIALGWSAFFAPTVQGKEIRLGDMLLSELTFGDLPILQVSLGSNILYGEDIIVPPVDPVDPVELVGSPWGSSWNLHDASTGIAFTLPSTDVGHMSILHMEVLGMEVDVSDVTVTGACVASWQFIDFLYAAADSAGRVVVAVWTNGTSSQARLRVDGFGNENTSSAAISFSGVLGITVGDQGQQSRSSSPVAISFPSVDAVADGQVLLINYQRYAPSPVIDVDDPAWITVLNDYNTDFRRKPVTVSGPTGVATGTMLRDWRTTTGIQVTLSPTPIILFADSFNRANGSLGGDWSPTAWANGGVVISSNRAVPVGSNWEQGDVYVTSATQSGDQEVTLVANPIDGGVQAILRYNHVVGEGLIFWAGAVGDCGIGYITGGTYTSLVDDVWAGSAIDVTLRAVATTSGNLSLFINDVLIASITDTRYNTNEQFGFGVYYGGGNAPSIDSFSVKF